MIIIRRDSPAHYKAISDCVLEQPHLPNMRECVLNDNKIHIARSLSLSVSPVIHVNVEVQLSKALLMLE